MFGLGVQELLLILVIVVVLFGAKKLPEVGAGLARGIRNFRKNLSENDADANQTDDAKANSDESKK